MPQTTVLKQFIPMSVQFTPAHSPPLLISVKTFLKSVPNLHCIFVHPIVNAIAHVPIIQLFLKILHKIKTVLCMWRMFVRQFVPCDKLAPSAHLLKHSS